MNDFHVGASARSLLTHLALYGLAGICQDAGHDQLRIGWSPGMDPRPVLRSTLSDEEIAELVLDHAAQRSTAGSWPKQDFIDAKGNARGLMSPRLSVLADDKQWETLQAERHRVLDELTREKSGLDLRMIAALGEPCYWRFHFNGDRAQNDAASRLEMQPRNQGSEFVGSRLRKAADAVAKRTSEAVLDGLRETVANDTARKNTSDSRSAAGLQPPGPVDDALAWCALWGIADAPLAYSTTGRAQTSVCLRDRDKNEYFYTPIWRGLWHPAHLRSILASGHFTQAASALIAPSADSASDISGQGWLADRGVTALVMFPVTVHGSASAPERRANQGILRPIAGRPA